MKEIRQDHRNDPRVQTLRRGDAGLTEQRLAAPLWYAAGAMTAHIRFARAGERSALEELQRRASLMWEDHRAALLAHPDAIALPPEQIHRRQVRVAVSGNELLGFSVVLPRRLWAELDGLFVEPARMREGLGSRLVEDAARLARRRGARTLWVVANPNAEAFYRRAGFQLLRRTETRFGRGLRMRLALAA